MSSLKAAVKGHQKTHRERSQVTGRKHLGLLEKRKDYVLRAKDFHRKEKTLKTLKKKASEKNPDEFYFQMINKKTKEGVHIKERANVQYTQDQIKLLKTQDINYINLKKNTETKKIEKLQANLHLTEEADSQKRTHIFFVDSKQEVKNFDVAKRLNTVPELLTRTHNIPTVDMLHKANFCKNENQQSNLKKNAYKELQNRIEREKQLSQARHELFLQRQLMGKGTVRKRRKNDGGTTYRWKKIRKR